MSVLLPAPLAPTSPMIPGSTWRSRLARALTGPKLLERLAVSMRDIAAA